MTNVSLLFYEHFLAHSFIADIYEVPILAYG